MAYLCTENGAHSTVVAQPERGALHLIRVYLIDDNGKRATFDVALNGWTSKWSSANGYVTNEWVHIAIASNGTAIAPYIDGHRVPDAYLGVPSDQGAAGRSQIRRSENAAWNGAVTTADVHNLDLAGFSLTSVTSLTEAQEDSGVVDAGCVSQGSSFTSKIV